MNNKIPVKTEILKSKVSDYVFWLLQHFDIFTNPRFTYCFLFLLYIGTKNNMCV